MSNFIKLHAEGGFDFFVKHSHIAGIEDGEGYRKVYLESGRVVCVTDSFKDLISLLSTGMTVSGVRDSVIYNFIVCMRIYNESHTVNQAIKWIEEDGNNMERSRLKKIRSLSSEEGVTIDDLLKEKEGRSFKMRVLTCLGENDDGEKVWALK